MNSFFLTREEGFKQPSISLSYMKYSLIALITILLTSCSSSGEKVTNVSYRGWDNCIQLSNNVATIIVNPTYGGQLLYYGLNSRDENILWSDSVVNGWKVEDYTRTRRSPDAGRFDIGNERKTEHIHDSIWAGPYRVSIEGNVIRLISSPSKAMGIQVERCFSLENNSSVLNVKQRMTNIADTIVEYCFWTRTLLPAGGVYFCESVPDSTYPSGFSEISLSADTLVPTGCMQERILVNNHYFTAYPGGNEEKKYGINTMNGIYSYQFRDYLYIKKNAYAPHGTYENNHQVRFPNMIYFNSQFIEMEPNSPMIRLKPGVSYDYEEVWTLIDLRTKK